MRTNTLIDLFSGISLQAEMHIYPIKHKKIVGPMTFMKCWTSVEDVWPALYKLYTNVLCLLGHNLS